MSRINTYPEADSLNQDDFLVVDGAIDGTRKLHSNIITGIENGLANLRTGTYNLIDCNDASKWKAAVTKNVTISIPKADTVRVTSNVSQTYAYAVYDIDVTNINTIYTQFKAYSGTGTNRSMVYYYEGENRVHLGTLSRNRASFNVSAYTKIAVVLAASYNTAGDGYMDYEEILVTTEEDKTLYVPHYIYEPKAELLMSSFNPVGLSQKARCANILTDTTWEGGYVTSTGVRAPTDKLEITSDYIDIVSKVTYEIKVKHLSNSSANIPWIRVGFYTSEKTYVRSVTREYSLFNDGDYVYIALKIMPSDEERYVRVSFRTYGDNYIAELIVSNDRLTWFTYPIPEPKDLQNGRNFTIKGVNHRGYGEYPENTLEAYIQSAIRGFNYVETDIRCTSDGVPVMLHDATINRTARNMDGTTLSAGVNISSITYAQSQEYDFGIYKGSQFAGIKIPKLEDFLSLCKKLGLHPYLDLKTGLTTAQFDGLVQMVLDYKMEDDITWLCGTTNFFIRALDVYPKFRIGVLTSAITEEFINTVLTYRTGENSVFIDSQSYTSAELELAKKYRLPVEVWTIDDEDVIKSLNSYITGVTSNMKIPGKIIYEDLTT